jgi:hypothetical protein
MSIATEISRLQTAKADIKTAIEAKGVTVPSNATLDTYDTYVSQISGGGGTNYLNDYIKGNITTFDVNTLGVFNTKLPKAFGEEYSGVTKVDLTGTGCTGWDGSLGPHGPFYYNSSNSTLQTIIIPSSCTTVGDYCFYKLDGLKLLDYSANAKILPRNAFRANSSITTQVDIVLRRTSTIYNLRDNPVSTTSATFRNYQNMRIYVPSALKASYEADTNWAALVTAGYATFYNLEGSDYE